MGADRVFEGLAQVARVHSRVAEWWLTYLRRLAEEMQKNPLLNLLGRSWEKDNLRMPLQVTPFQPTRADETRQAQQVGRQMGRESADEDAKKKTFPPEPLDTVIKQLTYGVLLGDPGAGKTEYLRYFIHTSASTQYQTLDGFQSTIQDIVLPVFLRLSDVAQCLFTDAAEAQSYLCGLGCQTVPQELDAAGRFAAALLRALLRQRFLPPQLAARVWLLLRPRAQALAAPEQATALIALDAWDEARGQVEKLSPLLADYVKKSPARVLVTSRLVDYGNYALRVETDDAKGPRRTLQVARFTPQETQPFIHNFFAAEKNGAVTAQRLWAELQHKPTMQGMSESPLLLTLLCMCFAPRRDSVPIGLPARRVEVYQRVIELFLSNVQEEKTKEDKSADLKPATERRIVLSNTEKSLVIKLLEETAYNFFPDENQAEDQEIDEENLREFINEQVTGNLTYQDLAHKLRARGRTVLEFLCETGLVKVTGEATPRYLFLHFTFEEDLLARALARRLEQKKPNRWLDDEEEPVQAEHTRTAILAANKWWRLVDHKAWHPYWQEVIIMLAGSLANPLPLLTLLADEETDDYFRHRLALAAHCLPEARNPKRDKALNGLLAEKIDELSNEAFLLWMKYAQDGNEKMVRPLANALPALGQAQGKGAFWQQQQPLIPFLEQVVLARLNNREGPNGWALQAIYRIGTPAAPQAILSALAQMLHSANDDVQRAASWAVRGLGPAAATPAILSALAQMLHSANDDLQREAAGAVGAIGPAAATQAIFSALAQMLHSTNDDVQQATAGAVGKIGPAAATSAILSALAQMLHSADADRQRAAAGAVGKIGPTTATPAILSALAQMLHSADADRQRAAAGAVGEIVKGELQAEKSNPATLRLLFIRFEDSVSDLVSEMHDDAWRFFYRPAADGQESAATALRVNQLSKGLTPNWE